MSGEIFIIQLGLGGVGQEIVRQYLQASQNYPWLRYRGIADRSGLCYFPVEWPHEALEAALDIKEAHGSLAEIVARWPEARFVAGAGALPQLDLLFDLDGSREQVVVDATAERAAYETLLWARSHDAHVVMCNKWALAEPQERYDALTSAGKRQLLYETTVGAALPVIGPLDRLLATGDEVMSIEAAISGTLGFVCSEIERGVPFSEALRQAQNLGYTEPDPRDDLAGVDARRKALILARKLGQRLNMADIEVEILVPPGLESVSLDEFWLGLSAVNVGYARRVDEAASRGNVLRFLAVIDGAGARVGLREVAKASPAGSLSGTESLFVFRTRRYGEQPMAVRGRGAGAALTASGVLADILSLDPGWR